MALDREQNYADRKLAEALQAQELHPPVASACTAM